MAEPKRKAGNPNFHKGMKSLNGQGRPKGSVNKYTALARELMSNKSPEIVEKVIEKAMAIQCTHINIMEGAQHWNQPRLLGTPSDLIG